ncbi:phosphoenolpyruvate mutase [Cohnella fermenti]|uniref:phosphoenolpyruvate mutase n=1 Tax=Cohnella fermenti TaxID=2565925 RepID=A0A4S4BZQ4_9BACL|nr:phosphoenolpyruvate mutase [Cohnella fermenti]THF80787.1 phosphoenolpyruvate mutase [Cohnella fermenti]
MKKTTKLMNMLRSNELEFIMEAHNGLSAKIVEEAGFKGIWGSGLSISAALGVRDNNEASWTQVLEVLEFMSDATTIPILLDGDTGYGNFNNMRRLVRKLEQRNIGGVCIEDKLFPKTNSFINGEAQPLADIDEFCGKIKAAKDEQQDDDFVVVARIEAFIAGWGLEEALKRAEAYRNAGADAILVHSKKSNPSDIEAFVQEWGNRHPLVIVPTKYYSTPTERFRELDISMIIWANHNVRSVITAMEHTTRTIFKDQSLRNIEGTISSVADIFRLQGAEELKIAEKKYLPTSGKNVNSIILAASKGEGLEGLTNQVPKALLKVNGRSLLQTQIDNLNQIGIKDVSVVRGFAKDSIQFTNITAIDNDKYETTKELYSLLVAIEAVKENTVISYGDIIYKSYILNELLNDSNEITIVVDADSDNKDGQYRDYVKTNKKYSNNVFSDRVELVEMGTHIIPSEVMGEFIGLWKVSENGAVVLRDALTNLAQRENIEQLRMSDLFNDLKARTNVSVLYIRGSWLDVDNVVDLQKAGDLYVN